MSITTAPADRYFVARSAGRYRVFETQADGTEVELAVVASRAKGEEKVAKLVAAGNAELDAAYAAKVAAEDEARAEDALTEAINRGDEAGADNARAALAEEPWGIPAVPAMQPCDGTCCPPKVACERRDDLGTAVVAAISPAAAKGTTKTADGAVILASGLVEGSPEANAAEAAESARLDRELGITKPVADTAAYRIGKVLDEWIAAHADDTDAALVAHIAGRNLCYDGTRTLRLTPAWVAELSAAASALENAALGADYPAAQKASAVRAARSARNTLAKLF